MSLIHAIILGFVEGITEFLPISSTGHMILVSSILHIPQTEFTKTFEISVQLGAILAVLLLSWQRLVGNKNVIKQVAAAFVPTAIIGFALYAVVKKYLLGNSLVTALSLIIGGILIFIFEWHLKRVRQEKTIHDLTLKQAVTIGIAQAIAVIPGVSRSAATIYSGIFNGITREEAVEFSFLLAFPTLLAASALDLIKSRAVLSTGNIGLLLAGAFVAFVTAYITIRWFLSFVKTNSLTPFAIYRIIVGILFLLIIR